MAKKYLDDIGLETVWNKIKSIFGMPEPLYEEVEWVESTGKQYVYLDWKPPIETWGFEADFIIKNKFNTTQAAWNSSTNTDNAGMLFGVRNTSGVNDVELGTYGSTGYFRAGGGTIPCGIKTDKTRQTIKLIGTTLTKPDGTTTTIQRSTENTSKPYHNMAIFAYYDGLRRSSYGGLNYPSTSRIYSLKFYEGETVKVHLVGAIRKSDNTTGLYDKISNHFYPAPAMNHGEVVGNLGQRNTILNTAQQGITCAMADNREAGRLWRINLSNIKALEDGQQISVMPLYSVPASVQTTELNGWDDTGSSSYVYLKATLADGTETDWIPCYYQQTTRLTSHYGSNQAILFTYRENVITNANATTAGYMIVRGFFGDVNYNTDRLYDCFSDSVIAGKNGAKRYTLCMQDDEGNWTSIVNQANNAGATGKTCYTGGFKLGKILYHATGGDYGAGANSGAMYQTYLVDARYSTNGITSSASTTTLQLRKPFYLVGTLGNDGLFYLDELQWWTQIEPISEDGKVYILVGWAYTSYYYIYLAANNPAYVYKNGKFRPLMDIYTIEADVPSNAKFTDTVTTATTTGDGNAVTSITASNGALTVTKGTTFLTQHQDISGKADKSATVSTVSYDSTNKKITKTINGTTSDVVTAATLKTAMGLDNAEVNQNAFSNVKIGSTTISADSKTDTLELAAGSNITLTPDATNDKITIAATDTTYESKAAAEDGTALSLVTTGEKYLWNNAASGTGSASWSNISGKPTETGESTTGISIGNHATGTVIGVQSSTTSVTGVQSSTTTASKVTLGTALSIPNVTGASDVTVPKAASSATTVPIKNATATSIPNVTDVGSASNWVFENITVPIKASSATTVPIAASSATTVPIKDASATSIPNVTDVGSGSASLTFTMDGTDTKKLIISFSHTHTPPTLGTNISVTGVQSTTTSVTGVNGSTSVTGVQSSTTTASHVKSGGNGTAPTLGTAISIYGVQSTTTSVTGVSGSTTASKVTLGTAIDVPNVTNVNDVTVPIKATSATTVPIKNTSASTFVTGTTHTITDNGHTHSIS